MKKSLLTATLTLAAVGRNYRQCLSGDGQLPEQNGSGVRANRAGGEIVNENRTQRNSLVHLAGSSEKGKQAHRQADFRRLLRDMVPAVQNAGNANLSRPQSDRRIAEMGDAQNRHRQANRFSGAIRHPSLPTLAVMRADGKPVTGTTGFLMPASSSNFCAMCAKKS